MKTYEVEFTEDYSTERYTGIAKVIDNKIIIEDECMENIALIFQNDEIITNVSQLR